MKEINVLRFILVLGIVLGHAPLHDSSFEEKSILLEVPIYNFIITHCMWSDIALLALFFVSGYLFFLNFEDRGWSGYFLKIDKRLISLVVPFISWNIIWLFYTIAKNTYFAHNNIPIDIELNSFSRIVKCFWAVDQGEYPLFPIAGYTWFLRDLFIFALLSPVYHYIFNKHWLCKIAVTLSIILLAYGEMLPFYNGALFLGGLLGYKKFDITIFFEKVNLYLSFAGLCLGFYSYYFLGFTPLAYLFMLLSVFCFFYKISILFKTNILINRLASFSTFLYLSHVLIMNFVGRFLVKLFTPDCDIEIVYVYYMNFILTILISFSIYQLFKWLKFDIIFLMLSGGRK